MTLTSALGACTFSDPIIHSRGDAVGGATGCPVGAFCGGGGAIFEPGLGGATGNPGNGGDTGCGVYYACGGTTGSPGIGGAIFDPGIGGTTGNPGLGGETGCGLSFPCGIGGAIGPGGSGGDTGSGGAFGIGGAFGSGGAFGIGGAFGGGGQGVGGAIGGGCEQVTSLSECEDRSDCYSVYFDPGNCNCAFPGCCAQFHHCASGFAAVCGGPVTCALLPPHCESPYVIARRDGCFEGCVFYGDCSP